MKPLRQRKNSKEVTPILSPPKASQHTHTEGSLPPLFYTCTPKLGITYNGQKTGDQTGLCFEDKGLTNYKYLLRSHFHTPKLKLKSFYLHLYNVLLFKSAIIQSRARLSLE